jgi:hypothetical protein
MIRLRRHSPKDYASFPDIDVSNVGTLSVDDQGCLDELGHFLMGANAHERFGATLLHRHFPIRANEILVEEVNADEKLITLRPVSDAPSDLFATGFCFEDADDTFGLVGLEFAAEDVLAGVSPVSGQDRNVLGRVQEILFHRGKTKRFGIRLLHDPIKLNGRVLLETCDPISRVLTCETTTEDHPSFAHAIATVFRWENGYGPMASQGCMQFCKRIQACNISRGGHKSSTRHETSH